VPVLVPVLVLASSSPRRLELVRRLGAEPARVVSPGIDEAPLPRERPRDYALRLAREKAAAVPRDADEVVLAGDTAVAAGRRVLPQAADADAVRECLLLLSGRRHRVYSAVCAVGPDGRERVRLSETIVTFRVLTTAELDAYAASGEGVGKAGGYAIQGRAEAWVRYLAGSHSGVVGLPLFEARAVLLAAGLALP